VVVVVLRGVLVDGGAAQTPLRSRGFVVFNRRFISVIFTLHRQRQQYSTLTTNSAMLLAILFWRYVALVVVLWRPASGVVVVVGVCNRSQRRTSKCTCLIFGVSIGLDPG